MSMTNDKKHKHLCCVFELSYVLQMDPNKNISSGASCEWQTGYFGKNRIFDKKEGVCHVIGNGVAI